MGFGEITMGPSMSEMLSVSKIHVKGVNISECEIPTACIQTNGFLYFHVPVIQFM